jgi:hypothetical protein
MASRAGLFHILIDGCLFTHNYGINVAYGAALSIDGLQDSEFVQEFSSLHEATAKKDNTKAYYAEGSALNSDNKSTSSSSTSSRTSGSIGNASPRAAHDDDHEHNDFKKTIFYGRHQDHNITFAPGLIQIENSTFTENYAGQRAAAINLKDIWRSKIKISHSTFTNNTGAYSVFEREHALPFFNILTSKTFKLNYMPYQYNELCQDEIQSIGEPKCFYQGEDLAMKPKEEPRREQESDYNSVTESLHFQYPQMKGAIYITGNQHLAIKSCIFTKNDAGPLLNDLQVIGMINNLNDYGNVQRASTIYVDQGTKALQVQEC